MNTEVINGAHLTSIPNETTSASPILSEIAAVPEKALLDESALAQMFRVSARTIKRWVQHGDIPPPARIGGRKVWMAGRILTFLEDRLTHAEAEGRRRVAAQEKALNPLTPFATTR
jgi:predicted DNA-binding transcriptional regulator AlpA